MSEHNFTLILTRAPDEIEIEGLFEAGCDDATFAGPDGVPVAYFSRDAHTMADAVLSAIENVESVLGDHSVVAVEPDLVSLADIAEMTGRSRQSIQQLAAGDRGEGSFPTPAAHVSGRTRLYRWWEVAQWFGLKEEVEDAQEIAMVNAALVTRAVQPHTALLTAYQALQTAGAA
jgi:hypothetical protein